MSKNTSKTKKKYQNKQNTQNTRRVYFVLVSYSDMYGTCPGVWFIRLGTLLKMLFPFSGGINCNKVGGGGVHLPFSRWDFARFEPEHVWWGRHSLCEFICLYIRLLLDNAVSLESPTTYTLRQKRETALTPGPHPMWHSQGHQGTHNFPSSISIFNLLTLITDVLLFTYLTSP